MQSGIELSGGSARRAKATCMAERIFSSLSRGSEMPMFNVITWSTDFMHLTSASARSCHNEALRISHRRFRSSYRANRSSTHFEWLPFGMALIEERKRCILARWLNFSLVPREFCLWSTKCQRTSSGSQEYAVCTNSQGHCMDGIGHVFDASVLPALPEIPFQRLTNRLSDMYAPIDFVGRLQKEIGLSFAQGGESDADDGIHNVVVKLHQPRAYPFCTGAY